MERADLVEAIHASPSFAVVAATGGGVALLADLLVVPGASRTVLEAMVPYSAASLESWVGGPVDAAVSAATAQRMAVAARHRASALVEAAGAPVVGLAVTAALASDRPKRGAHRAHLAACHPPGAGRADEAWAVTLAKGERSRAQEDRVVSDLGLLLLARACGIDADLDCGLGPGDVLER